MRCPGAVLSQPLLWGMDFNLRRTAFAEAWTTNFVFLAHYGDRISLADGAMSGTYQSPVYDWGVPPSLQLCRRTEFIPFMQDPPLSTFLDVERPLR